MKVKMKKVHELWNILYPDSFVVGEECDLTEGIVTTKHGNKFKADDLCKSFSNHCSHQDIFDKV